MLRTIVLGLALSMMVACSAWAQSDAREPGDTALPLEGTITNPDWVSQPTYDELGSVYPPQAMAVGAGGRAEISCHVTVTGSLENCTVVAESPPNLGFGQAALALTPYMRMRPMMIDGRPVSGAVVNIPIRFHPPEKPAPPTGPPPSPAAVALARRVVTAQGTAETLKQGIDRQLDAAEAYVRQAPYNNEAVRARVLASLSETRKQVEESIPAYVEKLAQLRARGLTEAQLAALASFLESPIGRAWTAQRLAQQADENQIYSDQLTGLQAEICLSVGCRPKLPPAVSPPSGGTTPSAPPGPGSGPPGS